MAANPAERGRLQADHAAWYLALAERADARLHTHEQLVWFSRLGEELGNLREALAYLEQREGERALRLSAALGHFWDTRGYYLEGYNHLSRLLEADGHDDVDDRVLAKASLRAAQLIWTQGDHYTAARLFEQSVSLADVSAEPSLWAEAVLGLGRIAQLNRGEYERVRAYYQSGLERARELQNQHLVAHALRLLGALNAEGGDYRQAKTCYEESADLYEALGDQVGRAGSVLNLATVLTDLGEFDAAHRLNGQSLELFRAVGDRHGEGVALLNLGMDASKQGDRAEAIRRYQESLALFTALGDQRMRSHLLNNLAGVYQKFGEPQKTLSLTDESLAILRRVGDVSLTSHALYLKGQAQHDVGERDKAYRCYQECVLLCRKNHENWALMRTLEALARWHLEGQDYPAAVLALEEASALAHAAGDHYTLGKVSATRVRLEAAQATGDTLRVAVTELTGSDPYAEGETNELR